MNNKGVILFDLDGTLIDSLPDLCLSVNYALNKCGFPSQSMDNVRAFIGDGVRMLIERALNGNANAKTIDAVLGEFLNHYSVHCTDNTLPYKGISELINSLNSNGYSMAVITNKYEAAAKTICDKYFPTISVVKGAVEGRAKKPNRQIVDIALNELSVSYDNAVIVGDSQVDIATAKAASLKSIIVKWGYGSPVGADAYVADTRNLYDKICCFLG